LPERSPAPAILLIEASATVALYITAVLQRMDLAVQRLDPAAASIALADNAFAIAILGAPAAALVPACAQAGVPVLALCPAGESIPGATATLALPLDPAALKAAVTACLPPQPLDHAAIVALWNDVANPIFKRIAAVFLDELATRLTHLSSLSAGTNRADVLHEAHAIKGSAANVGATALSSAALALETAAKSTHTELPPLMIKVQAAARQATAALRDLIA